MSDPAPNMAAIRELLTSVPPAHARREILAQLLAGDRSRARSPLRFGVVVFATLVIATAAVGMTVVPHWLAPQRPVETAVPVLPTSTATPATPHAPHRASPKPAPLESAAPEETLVPTPDLPASPPSVAPVPASGASSVKSSATSVPSVPSSPLDPSELAEQVAAFKEAESLLATSPGLAIVRLRAFKEHWPRSPLGEEASIRVIQALEALGRDADARAQAARFVSQYPRSSRRAELAAFAAGAKPERSEQ